MQLRVFGRTGMQLSLLGFGCGAVGGFMVRGDPGERSFSAFCYKAGQLVGIESVNRAADHVFGRKILGLNRSIEPEQAADMSFDLKAALT